MDGGEEEVNDFPFPPACSGLHHQAPTIDYWALLRCYKYQNIRTGF
jgi:hypothetical protein